MKIELKKITIAALAKSFSTPKSYDSFSFPMSP